MPRRPIDRQMRSQLVRPVLALVASRGGDLDALVTRFGLPPDARTAPEVVLPLREFRAFLDAAEVAAGDPFLGLTIAATLPRGTYGVLEFASRTAPTVREAMARVVRYMGLLNEIVGVSLREEGGEGVVEQFVDGEPACLGRHANEFFLAFMLASSRAMAGADIRASRVYFAHPAPKDTAPLAQLFGTRSLAFDQGRNGMALPSSTLDLPLVTSDPPLHSLLDQQAAAALGERAPTSRFVGTVERHVKAQLSGKEPSIADVASALRMSARTLQRRLAAEGVRWNDLVDNARRELALRYVEAGDRAVGEIAYLLGYAELSPFIRAFKRWTGTTPTAMRGARV